jgi:uncharacterized lipoprotein
MKQLSKATLLATAVVALSACSESDSNPQAQEPITPPGAQTFELRNLSATATDPDTGETVTLQTRNVRSAVVTRRSGS